MKASILKPLENEFINPTFYALPLLVLLLNLNWYDFQYRT
uniref:Uncharacterized protein n=1 Tax=Utricularia reniformis TaxID=192314 RepID=A0A1Y0B1X8_9LAMI|nr:hypothetical protein AEK19_MT1144 [Utricularia reniformis]ART31359.1 hypothetical protein AEK19_MT1144 [Utricularia reniformis]